MPELDIEALVLTLGRELLEAWEDSRWEASAAQFVRHHWDPRQQSITQEEPTDPEVTYRCWRDLCAQRLRAGSSAEETYTRAISMIVQLAGIERAKGQLDLTRWPGEQRGRQGALELCRRVLRALRPPAHTPGEPPRAPAPGARPQAEPPSGRGRKR